MHYEFVPGSDVTVHCLPKGSGCENMSFLKMLVPADGVRGIKRFVLECIVESAGKPCLPNVCGVGIGGSADLCTTLAKRALLRPVGDHNHDPLVAALEDELFALANELGLGPMGLGGDSTLLAVHIEHAHTHITQNPVSVCMECWNARHASARRHARRRDHLRLLNDGGDDEMSDRLDRLRANPHLSFPLDDLDALRELRAGQRVWIDGQHLRAARRHPHRDVRPRRTATRRPARRRGRPYGAQRAPRCPTAATRSSASAPPPAPA